ncbi:Protein of unknown function, partial [Gryllus bimaculatus]
MWSANLGVKTDVLTTQRMDSSAMPSTYRYSPAIAKALRYVCTMMTHAKLRNLNPWMQDKFSSVDVWRILCPLETAEKPRRTRLATPTVNKLVLRCSFKLVM